jgi:hypothetical protein
MLRSETARDVRSMGTTERLTRRALIPEMHRGWPRQMGCQADAHRVGGAMASERQRVGKGMRTVGR